MKSIISGLIAIGISTAVLADATTDKITKAIGGMTGLQVQSVKKMNVSDLYEVRAQGNVFYTTKKVEWFIAGQLFDIATKENLTQKAAQEMQAFRFSDFPLEKAIKIVRGNGKRKIVTFEDPNCSYCKKLAEEITKIDDVTVYVMPLAILSPDSETKIINILCSADPSSAWRTVLAGSAVDECNNETKKQDGKARVGEIRELAAKYMVQGTPAIFYQNRNTRTNGYEQADAIEAHLKTGN